MGKLCRMWIRVGGSAPVPALSPRCSGVRRTWGGTRGVGVRDPVLRVGPKGCKLLVDLRCSPEILLRQKWRSCGVAEGVRIVEREAERDGYHLFLCFVYLFVFNTVVKPSAAGTALGRSAGLRLPFAPRCTCAVGCCTQPPPVRQPRVSEVRACLRRGLYKLRLAGGCGKVKMCEEDRTGQLGCHLPLF